MNFEIRKINIDDNQRIIEICHQHLWNINWEEWDHLHSAKCRFVLLTEHNILIGFCALKPIPEPKSAEVAVYLDKNFQNLGLERLLLKRLVFSSEAENFHILRTKINLGDWERMDIYEKQYFKPVVSKIEESSEYIILQRISRIA